MLGELQINQINHGQDWSAWNSLLVVENTTKKFHRMNTKLQSNSTKTLNFKLVWNDVPKHTKEIYYLDPFYSATTVIWL